MRLCRSCQMLITGYKGRACRLCGVPGASLDAKGRCLECARISPPWHGLAYYGIYAGPLRDLILRLKYDAELQIARTLADFLLQAGSALPCPDSLVAIPQYGESLRKRGFNQANEIMRNLAKLGGFRIDRKALWKIRASAPQEALGARARKQNLVGAFKASPQVEGKVIWLIDDVMTTGSTCAEATRALLEAGALKVFALCVARTPLE